MTIKSFNDRKSGNFSWEKRGPRRGGKGEARAMTKWEN
jgi:hypothetical protein